MNQLQTIALLSGSHKKRKYLEILEAVQRGLTLKIAQVKEMNYDRLNALRLYSIQKCFERFINTNIWKFLGGNLVNVTEKIDTKVTLSISRGSAECVTSKCLTDGPQKYATRSWCPERAIIPILMNCVNVQLFLS